MNRKLIIAIIAVLVIVCAGMFVLTNTNSSGASAVNIDAAALEDGGNLIVDSEKLDKNNVFFHTDSSDVNAILVKNGGTLKLANSIINKTGDTQTSGDDADFYGVNSAILVNTNGTLDISNAEINTNSKGSNGIFVTNANASSDSSSQEETADSNLKQPETAEGLEASHLKLPAMVEEMAAKAAEANRLKCHPVKVLETADKHLTAAEANLTKAQFQEPQKPPSTM